MTQHLPASGRQADDQFTVTLRGQFARLRLSGELDIDTAAEFTRTLEGLDLMSNVRLHVDMTEVAFIDTSGVRPLVDAARRRRDQGRAPLLIDGISRPAQRLLTVAGLGAGQQLDIDGWDRLAADPT